LTASEIARVDDASPEALLKATGGGEDGDRYATKVKVGEKREYLHSFASSLFD
jgi:hypothetical protein